MEEEMVVHAIQEELNYLFSDSLTDADLLRAVECIESTVDQALQTSAASNVIETTARTGSLGNAEGVETAAQLQFGKFCTLII